MEILIRTERGMVSCDIQWPVGVAQSWNTPIDEIGKLRVWLLSKQLPYRHRVDAIRQLELIEARHQDATKQERKPMPIPLYVLTNKNGEEVGGVRQTLEWWRVYADIHGDDIFRCGGEYRYDYQQTGIQFYLKPVIEGQGE